MSARPSSKRLFGLVSCVSIAGAVATLSANAHAQQCPAPDLGGPLEYADGQPSKACTDADLALFDAEAKKPGATYKQVETALEAQSATCAACVFTDVDDPKWGPVVYVGDEGGALRNLGVCAEKLTGDTLCAEALYQLDVCVLVRCGECPNQAGYDACVAEVLADEDSCGLYNPYFYCDEDDADLILDECTTLSQSVHVACGGAPTPPPPGSSSGGSSSGGSSSGGSSSGGSSSGGTSSGGSSSGDAEPDPSENSSSGGKNAPPSKSSDDADEGTTSATTSGCAQGPGSGGSVASALILGAAIVGAVSRRRRQ